VCHPSANHSGLTSNSVLGLFWTFNNLGYHSTTWTSLSHNWAGRGSRRVERPTTVRAYVNPRYLEIGKSLIDPLTIGVV
jgi:hypothetical protein